MRKRTLAGLSVSSQLLALALVAAGCGGGGSSSGNDTTTRAPARARREGRFGWRSAASRRRSTRASRPTRRRRSSSGTSTRRSSASARRRTSSPCPRSRRAGTSNGANITLHLRNDVKWTDGTTVTADDVVWSWLRTISPQLGADYAYQFYGIKGAQEYNSCKPSAANQQCDTLKSKVAITAPDATTVKIAAHLAAAVVHAAAVAHLVHPGEQGGGRRSGATSGPSRATTSATARSR